MTKEEFIRQYLADRSNTDCCKWDAELEEKYGSRDLISMWIADMEFRTPEAVVDALCERIRHGVYGYSTVPEEYYTALSDWMQNRYGLPVAKESVRFCTGCVTAIAWMLQAFTKPGDACLILTPVYYPFHNVVTYNDRKLVTVDLNCDENDCFTMNYEAIEQAIVDNKVKLLLQCSPHNPVGRVWTEDELIKLFEICRRHHVLVVSDEIHQDLCLFGHSFVPALAVANGAYRDRIVTLNAASKTFNLAGLIHSHIIIPDEKLRAQYDQFARGMDRNAANIMGLTATLAGYTHGAQWLECLIQVIEENYSYLTRELQKRAPDVIVTPLEGTYLALIDLRRCMAVEDVHDFILKDCKLAVDYGEQFGEHFKGFVRLNLATDPMLVKQAVQNIVTQLAKRKG
ncbi:MAG: MalY/PatB family protein [Faecousia sp.]